MHGCFALVLISAQYTMPIRHQIDIHTSRPYFMLHSIVRFISEFHILI